MNRFVYNSYHHQPNYIGFVKMTQCSVGSEFDEVIDRLIDKRIKEHLDFNQAAYHVTKRTQDPYQNVSVHLDMWRKNPYE